MGNQSLLMNILKVYKDLVMHLMQLLRIAVNLILPLNQNVNPTRAEQMAALTFMSSALIALRLDFNYLKSAITRTSPITKENLSLNAGMLITLAFSSQKLLAAQRRIQEAQINLHAPVAPVAAARQLKLT